VPSRTTGRQYDRRARQILIPLEAAAPAARDISGR
jgi:hypothetical protein